MADIFPQEKDMPPSISWISELLKRVPGHSVMAGLFVYCFFYVIPDKDAWYWQQLEKQRKEYADARVVYEDRKELQLKEVEKLCYGAITSVETTAQKNYSLLVQIEKKIEEECFCGKK